MRASKPKFQESKTDFSKLRIAIVHATWNSEFNSEMAKAARETLESRGVNNIDSYEIPGAFEMPVFCKRLTESLTRKYDAILCYATVIRGETAHFDLVANESTRGIMQVATETGLPILNGILACENEAQASARASMTRENKGAEVALSALALLHELSKIK